MTGEGTVCLLDHGYVKLIETWGSDARIIEAARMSTDKGFQGWGPTALCAGCGSKEVRRDTENEHPGVGWCYDCDRGCYIEDKPGDEKLLRYLWEHKHATPFEMAGMTIEVQAPIFVFREWHRHRTQSYNELSARYTALPDLFYVPSIERLQAAKQSTTNKQASDEAATFTQQQAKDLQREIQQSQRTARELYQDMLDAGVAREVARVVIPVSQYSRMRASANLRNWLQFLTLRMAAQAQWEIRQYANVVGEIVSQQYPRTWELFSNEGR